MVWLGIRGLITKSGKARYIGVSTMLTGQLAKILMACERNGWVKPINMQLQLNCAYREEEREIEYARDTMPRGVLGMNAAMMEDYLKFIANRRLSQIGLKEEYPGTTNPFPWMSEIMDLKKEKNFFETRVIEYQTGGALSWD